MKKFIATIKKAMINSTKVFNETDTQDANYETMNPLSDLFMNRAMWL